MPSTLNEFLEKALVEVTTAKSSRQKASSIQSTWRKSLMDFYKALKKVKEGIDSLENDVGGPRMVDNLSKLETKFNKSFEAYQMEIYQILEEYKAGIEG